MAATGTLVMAMAMAMARLKVKIRVVSPDSRFRGRLVSRVKDPLGMMVGQQVLLLALI